MHGVPLPGIMQEEYSVVTMDLLGQFTIFDTVPPDLLKDIEAKAEIAPYAPGEVVVSADQPFTFFGVILEGEMEAYLAEQQEEPHSIESLRAGSHIGAMALLTGTD